MRIRRVLIIGSGGREHALAWRLARDPDMEILVAPGNDGIARRFECVPVANLEGASLSRVGRDRSIDLAVIGPERPLAEGLADDLSAAGILTFGPRRGAARLESSKWFAKGILREAGVPTARAECVETLAAALAALDRFDPPWVLKADGLAAGKGVLVTSDRSAAERFLAERMERGDESGRRTVLEEFLEGEEASVMAVCDGTDAVLLPAARDSKRAHDGDLGPNTGGMGALAPHPVLDATRLESIRRQIVLPVLRVMEERGTPYRGTLYCGLMLSGPDTFVIEFNCRFGDPETQVIVPLVDGSLADLLASAALGAIDRSATRPARGAAVTVALVGERYPDEGPIGAGALESQGRGGTDRPDRGVIDGLERLMHDDELVVFHAATRFDGGAWRVRGGRAAYVTAVADTIDGARQRVYGAIGTLGGEGWRCRSDIADLARGSAENRRANASRTQSSIA